MDITYNISSYKTPSEEEMVKIRAENSHVIITPGDLAYDELDHATTGDGTVAYGLFEDLMEENPDRVFVISAYIPLVREEGINKALANVQDELKELVTYISGSAKEESLTIKTFRKDHPALEATLESLGLEAA
jgi:hypothetical protein